MNPTAADIPVILRLTATVAGLTEQVFAGLWRRYPDLLLDELSTLQSSPAEARPPSRPARVATDDLQS